MRLTIVPIRWEDACRFSDALHRHLSHPRGGKFSLGVVDGDGKLRGVALCGRPVARGLDDGLTLEVNRTATDGCRNANSALYGACWRVAAAMGYRRLVTYTQEGESGSSLRAAGYRQVRELPARGSWLDHSKARIWASYLRNPVGAGGLERIMWEKSGQDR